jgi:hypothetical protein
LRDVGEPRARRTQRAVRAYELVASGDTSDE